MRLNGVMLICLLCIYGYCWVWLLVFSVIVFGLGFDVCLIKVCNLVLFVWCLRVAVGVYCVIDVA